MIGSRATERDQLAGGIPRAAGVASAGIAATLARMARRYGLACMMSEALTGASRGPTTRVSVTLAGTA
jgi:hypothetical protein